MQGVLSSVLLGIAALCHAAPPPSPQVALVARLYRDFLHEVVVEEPGFEPFYNFTPRSVLLKYLTPELTQLLINDRQCEMKGDRICHLGWSPICTGQNSSGLSARIRATHAADKVEVEIRSTASAWDAKGIMSLYRMTETARGWRIRDIEYEGRSSLFQILKGPM
jgi:hypothetical protein